MWWYICICCNSSFLKLLIILNINLPKNCSRRWNIFFLLCKCVYFPLFILFHSHRCVLNTLYKLVWCSNLCFKLRSSHSYNSYKSLHFRLEHFMWFSTVVYKARFSSSIWLCIQHQIRFHMLKYCNVVSMSIFYLNYISY